MNAIPSATARASDSVAQAILAALGAAATPLARPFVEHFFRRVGGEEASTHAAEDWTGMVRGLLDFVRVRKAGVPILRVFNPVKEADGYASAHTVIDIMTDDMPFLVDSVGIAIAQAGLSGHLVVHPVYAIERDAGGNVLAIAAEGNGKGKGESLMHFEVDRVAEPAERAQLEQALLAALDDVAQCYRDWPAMRDRMLAIADSLAGQKRPIDAASVT
ncbi:MAG: NAD-glutamate dehydrogenase, partial [Proteobacteria bacterium]|nr:NAD-glutamate dehydrogenase [Pseudomonadota bacterium]